MKLQRLRELSTAQPADVTRRDAGKQSKFGDFECAAADSLCSNIVEAFRRRSAMAPGECHTLRVYRVGRQAATDYVCLAQATMGVANSPFSQMFYLSWCLLAGGNAINIQMWQPNK